MSDYSLYQLLEMYLEYCRLESWEGRQPDNYQTWRARMEPMKYDCDFTVEGE